ncbi:tripartite tricarboxylate transporter substrate binding protein [Chelativorans sp. ZYF759]|uniref:Bug family tripartite tricarboxylate transporter substrate binding protein n=1 Tax=Chelativorans sp. ZYF759 TaxID=2692213 RepID=UPI00145F3C54|nr:tripartite tricarboxylate transporter substrate binding protein [Chelativorans sp. ZYF759]NMG37855.1 tripartite tricarboxylate transporter substrate binding protein [Chelativorans sp. ZYF759]
MGKFSKFLTVATLAAAVSVAGMATGVAIAQDYPDKPVTIVVPFPPGGSTDLLARQIADKISGPLGQPVVVENRGGAGGTVGANYVAQSTPDGYTLLMGVTGSNAISGILRDDLPYDAATDFAPVSIVVSSPLVLAVNADSDLETVEDVVAFAEANPGAFTHGSPGVGTSMHMTGEMFALESGTSLLHIPYQGSAAALQDLLGGNLVAMFGDILVLSEHFESGALRPIAVTSLERHFMLPDVPTIAESGLDGFEAVSWQGVFAPTGTPQEILDRLYAEISTAMEAEEMQAFFEDRGFLVEGRSPSDSQAFVVDQIEMWSGVVDAAGIVVE